MKKIYSFLFALFIVLNVAHAQFSVNTSLPLSQLIQNFVGSNIAISNVTFTGGPLSIGSFSSGTNYPMPMGLILTSGNVDSTLGLPASNTVSGYLSMPGDLDLDALSNGSPTYDAASLEFDFVASGTQFEFHYSFASEEYDEFVGASFNDIFALFLSGPGINTPVNLANIPGTTLPVAINSVNNGPNNAGPCFNCSYYISNANDTIFCMDGLTTVLTAQHAITPGLTYHVKIAVADVADGIFDSSVLLEAYSLKSTGNTSLVENSNFTDAIFVNGNSINMSSVDAASQVQLCDTKGSIVISQTGNKNIDIANLPSGTYILTVSNNNNISRKKIVF